MCIEKILVRRNSRYICIVRYVAYLYLQILIHFVLYIIRVIPKRSNCSNYQQNVVQQKDSITSGTCTTVSNLIHEAFITHVFCNTFVLMHRVEIQSMCALFCAVWNCVSELYGIMESCMHFLNVILTFFFRWARYTTWLHESF